MTAYKCAISNSGGRGTKQPAGAKFTYSNVQAGNACRTTLFVVMMIRGGASTKVLWPKSRIINWLQCDTCRHLTIFCNCGSNNWETVVDRQLTH